MRQYYIPLIFFAYQVSKFVAKYNACLVKVCNKLYCNSKNIKNFIIKWFSTKLTFFYYVKCDIENILHIKHLN